MVHLNIRVHGKVQGVFFRAYTQEKAAELGVCGFVRNEPDGSVYVEAEGSEEALQQFVEWLHKGSPNAHVTEVNTESGEAQGYDTFQIRY